MHPSFLTIDVAHPPRHPDVVEDELLAAWTQVRNSPTLRVLKIIHGHGSSGSPASTKETVRNWAFRNRNKFRDIIEGESFSLYNGATQELAKELEDLRDADMDSANPGIIIIWVK